MTNNPNIDAMFICVMRIICYTRSKTSLLRAPNLSLEVFKVSSIFVLCYVYFSRKKQIPPLLGAPRLSWAFSLF